MILRKNNISFTEMLNDPKKIKYAHKQAKNKKNYEIARQIGLYYLHNKIFQNALFWFKTSLDRGGQIAHIDLARLHFICISQGIDFIEDLIGKTYFSIDEALNHLDHPQEKENYKEITKLKTQIMFHKYGLCEQVYKSALNSVLYHCDWSRSIILLGCYYNNIECLMNKNKEDAIKHWIKLFDIEADTAILLVKFILSGYINDGLIGHKDSLLQISLEKQYPEAMYIYGREIIKKDYFKAENYLRKAFNLGFIDAGVFLADWKSVNDNPVNQTEILTLYKECANRGHLSSKCLLAIKQFQGHTIGLTMDQCKQYIEEGILKKNPLALAWQNNRQFI